MNVRASQWTNPPPPSLEQFHNLQAPLKIIPKMNILFTYHQTLEDLLAVGIGAADEAVTKRNPMFVRKKRTKKFWMSNSLHFFSLLLQFMRFCGFLFFTDDCRRHIFKPRQRSISKRRNTQRKSQGAQALTMRAQCPWRLERTCRAATASATAECSICRARIEQGEDVKCTCLLFVACFDLWRSHHTVTLSRRQQQHNKEINVERQ